MKSLDLRPTWRRDVPSASSWKRSLAWITISGKLRRMSYSLTGKRSSNIWTQTRARSKSNACLIWGNSVSYIASFATSRLYWLISERQSLDIHWRHTIKVSCWMKPSLKVHAWRQASSSQSSASLTSLWPTWPSRSKLLSSSDNSKPWFINMSQSWSKLYRTRNRMSHLRRNSAALPMSIS